MIRSTRIVDSAMYQASLVAERMAEKAPVKNDPPKIHYIPLGITKRRGSLGRPKGKTK